MCKDKYPIYAVHPDNLVPLCDTCNKKAKRAKELLENSTGARRLSFYPKTEDCKSLVRVELIDGTLSPEITVRWDSTDSNILEKLNTWDSVYDIKNRVQGEQGDYVVWLDKETRANDFSDFLSQIVRHNRRPTVLEVQSETWLIWRYKLYQWIGLQGQPIKRQIWDMIVQRRSDADHAEVFNI